MDAIQYVSGLEGFLAEIPASSARQAVTQTGPVRLQKGSTNGILQGYPCLRATFRVLEEIGQDTTLDTDAQGDVLFGAGVFDDPAMPLALDERYLPGPDALEP